MSAEGVGGKVMLEQPPPTGTACAGPGARDPRASSGSCASRCTSAELDAGVRNETANYIYSCTPGVHLTQVVATGVKAFATNKAAAAVAGARTTRAARSQEVDVIDEEEFAWLHHSEQVGRGHVHRRATAHCRHDCRGD